MTSQAWTDWAAVNPSQTLEAFLDARFGSNEDRTGSTASQAVAGRRPQVIIFGEQHHQPKILAAQLKLVHKLATDPLDLKVTVVMEHFNVLQQGLLDDFAKTGDAQALQQEYAKSSEGFRLDNTGYLPLLNLIRALDNDDSAVKAGFPPREWARTIMRNGKEALLTDETAAEVLRDFDRWEDINVSPEHAAYISSSISGEKPKMPTHVSQGGLKAAQAFKDAIMAHRIDQEVDRMQRFKNTELDSRTGIIVAICGSGHCEYGFGVTERIRSCRREDVLLLVCKPDDSIFWTDSPHQDGKPQGGRAIADGIILYEAIDV